MAQTTEKIRFVYGTEAKYSSSAYGKDIYFCTDTRRIYARGVAYGAVDEGPWYTLSPYLYQDETLYYYYIKIATITTGKSTHFRTLEFEVHDDANYATSCRYWLTMNVYSSTIKNLSLICTTTVDNGSAMSAKMTAYLDTSGGVWVRFPSVDWGQRVRVRSVMEYSSSDTPVSTSIPFHTSPSKQTAKPANLSDPVSYSGGIRYSGSAFSYQKAYIHAKADSAEECTYANRLAAARTLWGQSFNGTANVSGALSGVPEINSSGTLNLDSSAAGNSVALRAGGTNAHGVAVLNNEFRRLADSTAMSLGTATYRWNGIYGTSGSFTDELVNSAANAMRLTYGSKAVILRKDDGNFYFLIADSDAAGSNWNNLRPFFFSLSNGKVNMQNGVAISSGLTVSGDTDFNSASLTLSDKDKGKINTALVTSSYLRGNQGYAILNSTAAAGSYVAFLKGNSTNGHFTMSVFQNAFHLYYTAKSTVTSGTNTYSLDLKLFDESGNTSFPGIVKAIKFDGNLEGNVTGDLTGNASSATVANYIKSAGRMTAYTGTTMPTYGGLVHYEVYNNGYPCSYGNVLTLRGVNNTGCGQLLLGWTGDTTRGKIYYRSKRDVSTTGWSEWGELAFKADIKTYTLPAATNTVLGGVKLFSATVQSVSANAVSATSGRTYGVQKNSSGQLVVNVPWANTTYPLASDTANGLMSATQKHNLDILVSNALTGLTWSGGALKYEHVSGSTGTVAIPAATTGANGLMSASDKAKLDSGKFTTEVASSAATAFRLSYGSYGVLLRNDGADFYILLTAKGQAASGNFNSLRPFRVNLSTGKVYMQNGLEANSITTDALDAPSATTSKAGLMSATDKKRADELYGYINQLKYQTLRVPYKLFSASSGTSVTLADSHFSGTQWASASAFRSWLLEFAEYGSTVLVETTSATNATVVRQGLWTFRQQNTGTHYFKIEYQTSFSTGANNPFDGVLTFTLPSAGGVTVIKRDNG